MNDNSFQPTDLGAPAAAAPADGGFEAWLAARKSVLSRPTREASGLLLLPGTPVLMPDPENPDKTLRDTPENRARLRADFEREAKAAQAAADEARKTKEAADAAERAKRLPDFVRETADGLIATGRLSVSLARFRESLVLRHGEFAGIGLDSIRASLLELQKSERDKYAVCVDDEGTEMFRKATAIGRARRIFC